MLSHVSLAQAHHQEFQMAFYVVTPKGLQALQPSFRSVLRHEGDWMRRLARKSRGSAPPFPPSLSLTVLLALWRIFNSANWQIDSDCCAFSPKSFVQLPRIPFRETIEIRRCFARCAERLVMKSSAAKYYGCKRVKHCGVIANADAVKRIEFFLV